MGILQILATDNFITVNRTVASIVGLEAAVIFGELASESNYWSQHNPDADGWFFSTVENLEKRTFLSAHQQRNAIQRLEEQGWIETEKKGMPARRFIRMKEAEIIKSLNNQSLKILTTSDKKNERPVVKNFDDNKKNISNNNIEKEKREKKDETPSSIVYLELDPEHTNEENMQKLIQYTAGAYNIRVKDPENTIRAWMDALKQYSPEDILNSIRFHISTNKYFPNPHEIAGNIQKAKLVFNHQEPEMHPEENNSEIETDIDNLIDFINNE